MEKQILLLFCAFLFLTVTFGSVTNLRLVGNTDNINVNTVIIGKQYRLVWDYDGTLTHSVTVSFDNNDITTIPPVLISQLEASFVIPPMEVRNGVYSTIRFVSEDSITQFFARNTVDVIEYKTQVTWDDRCLESSCSSKTLTKLSSKCIKLFFGGVSPAEIEIQSNNVDEYTLCPVHTDNTFTCPIVSCQSPTICSPSSHLCQCPGNFAGALCSSCKTGYSGLNCDSCDVGFSGDNCNECLPGYFYDYLSSCLPSFDGLVITEEPESWQQIGAADTNTLVYVKFYSYDNSPNPFSIELIDTSFSEITLVTYPDTLPVLGVNVIGIIIPNTNTGYENVIIRIKFLSLVVDSSVFFISAYKWKNNSDSDPCPPTLCVDNFIAEYHRTCYRLPDNSIWDLKCDESIPKDTKICPKTLTCANNMQCSTSLACDCLYGYTSNDCSVSPVINSVVVTEGSSGSSFPLSQIDLLAPFNVFWTLSSGLLTQIKLKIELINHSGDVLTLLGDNIDASLGIFSTFIPTSVPSQRNTTVRVSVNYSTNYLESSGFAIYSFQFYRFEWAPTQCPSDSCRESNQVGRYRCDRMIGSVIDREYVGESKCLGIGLVMPQETQLCGKSTDCFNNGVCTSGNICSCELPFSGKSCTNRVISNVIVVDPNGGGHLKGIDVTINNQNATKMMIQWDYFGVSGPIDINILNDNDVISIAKNVVASQGLNQLQIDLPITLLSIPAVKIQILLSNQPLSAETSPPFDLYHYKWVISDDSHQPICQVDRCFDFSLEKVQSCQQFIAEAIQDYIVPHDDEFKCGTQTPDYLFCPKNIVCVQNQGTCNTLTSQCDCQGGFVGVQCETYITNITDIEVIDVDSGATIDQIDIAADFIIHFLFLGDIQTSSLQIDLVVDNSVLITLTSDFNTVVDGSSGDFSQFLARIPHGIGAHSNVSVRISFNNIQTISVKSIDVYDYQYMLEPLKPCPTPACKATIQTQKYQCHRFLTPNISAGLVPILSCGHISTIPDDVQTNCSTINLECNNGGQCLGDFQTPQTCQCSFNWVGTTCETPIVDQLIITKPGSNIVMTEIDAVSFPNGDNTFLVNFAFHGVKDTTVLAAKLVNKRQNNSVISLLVASYAITTTNVQLSFSIDQKLPSYPKVALVIVISSGNQSVEFQSTSFQIFSYTWRALSPPACSELICNAYKLPIPYQCMKFNGDTSTVETNDSLIPVKCGQKLQANIDCNTPLELCQNGSSCNYSVQSNQFCQCLFGFYGVHCEFAPNTITSIAVFEADSVTPLDPILLGVPFILKWEIHGSDDDDVIIELRDVWNAVIYTINTTRTTTLDNSHYALQITLPTTIPTYSSPNQTLLRISLRNNPYIFHESPFLNIFKYVWESNPYSCEYDPLIQPRCESTSHPDTVCFKYTGFYDLPIEILGGEELKLCGESPSTVVRFCEPNLSCLNNSTCLVDDSNKQFCDCPGEFSGIDCGQPLFSQVMVVAEPTSTIPLQSFDAADTVWLRWVQNRTHQGLFIWLSSLRGDIMIGFEPSAAFEIDGVRALLLSIPPQSLPFGADFNVVFTDGSRWWYTDSQPFSISKHDWEVPIFECPARCARFSYENDRNDARCMKYIENYTEIAPDSKCDISTKPDPLHHECEPTLQCQNSSTCDQTTGFCNCDGSWLGADCSLNPRPTLTYEGAAIDIGTTLITINWDVLGDFDPRQGEVFELLYLYTDSYYHGMSSYMIEVLQRNIPTSDRQLSFVIPFGTPASLDGFARFYLSFMASATTYEVGVGFYNVYAYVWADTPWSACTGLRCSEGIQTRSLSCKEFLSSAEAPVSKCDSWNMPLVEMPCYSGDVCQNFGYCGGDGTCICPSGWSGQFCEIAYHPECDPNHSKCLNGGYVTYDPINQWCDSQCTCSNNWRNSQKYLASVASAIANPIPGCDECSLVCSNHIISHNRRDTGHGDSTCQTCVCERGYSGDQCNCKEFFFTLSFSSFPSYFKSSDLYTSQLSTRVETISDYQAQILDLSNIQYHFQDALGVANTTVGYWKKTAEKGKDDILTLTVNIPTFCASELMIMNSEKLSGFSVQAATDNIYSSLQNFIDELNDNNNIFGIDGFKPRTPVQLSTSVYNPTCAPNDFSIGSTYDCKSANGVSPFPQGVTTEVSNGDKDNKTALIAIIIALSVVIAVIIGVGIALYCVLKSEPLPKQPKQKKTKSKKTTTDQSAHPSETHDVESQVEIKVVDYETTDDVETDSMHTNKTDSKVSNDKGEAEGEKSITTTVDEANEVEQTTSVEEDDSPAGIDVVGSTVEVDVEPTVENNMVESKIEGKGDDESTVQDQSKDIESTVEGVNGANVEQTSDVVVLTETNTIESTDTPIETNDAAERPVVEPNTAAAAAEPTVTSASDEAVTIQPTTDSD